MAASAGGFERSRRTGEGLGPSRDGFEVVARYLLDTNHLSAALDFRSAFRVRLYQYLQAGNRFGTCVQILCELETGIHQTLRRDRNRQSLTVLLRQIRIWPPEPTIAPLYAENYHELRDQGRVLSQVDMLLVALARSIGATLPSSDRDFEARPGLRVENWLT
jgi:predicted nucleic acid-binding protein